jgi:transposase
MQDVQLYQQILGLESPWKVSRVELDVDLEEIRVHVGHPRGMKFRCPECQVECRIHDHAEERRWRHLDSCQFKTFLVTRPPRVKCPEHGVKTILVPWAERGCRFTSLFERFALDVLLATQTVAGAMWLLQTSWGETWHFLERAVARGLERKEAKLLPRVGIDEKAFARGHTYITLLYDLDHSTVEAIADGHDTDSAIACFSQLSREQIASIEAIAMDMSPAYVKAAKQTLPLAEQKIVHDRFHVMQLVTKAVDQIRRAEHRKLLLEDNPCLAKTKYLWLTNQENLSENQQVAMDRVFSLRLETGRAWGYKELLRDLWDHDDAGAATDYFKDWYRRVIHTKLTPLKKVARTIRERLDNVVSYCTHGVTNGVAEGLNSKIMSIKRRVGGFRNRENFKTAIKFYCGGLDLYPR